MFKNLTSDKTLKNVLMLILVVAVIYIVYQIYNNYMKKEGFEADADETEKEVVENMENQDDEPQMMTEQQMMPPQQMMEGQQPEMMSNPVDRDMRNAQMMGVAGDQLTAQDLLPQDKSSTWAQVNPEGQGSLANQNFLQSGYHIGINTVGQTLRNANLQLRSEPPCPQVQVSPWLQTTIEPDVSRRPMEIGGCA
jgi:hypothetical protein